MWVCGEATNPHLDKSSHRIQELIERYWKAILFGLVHLYQKFALYQSSRNFTMRWVNKVAINIPTKIHKGGLHIRG